MKQKTVVNIVQGGLNIFIPPNTGIFIGEFGVCVGGWVCGIRISEIIIEY